MLMFGIGETLKIVLIAKACFLPMMINSFDGVRGISSRHRDVARTLEMGGMTPCASWSCRRCCPTF